MGIRFPTSAGLSDILRMQPCIRRNGNFILFTKLYARFDFNYVRDQGSCSARHERDSVKVIHVHQFRCSGRKLEPGARLFVQAAPECLAS